jgi:hypothetical protein
VTGLDSWELQSKPSVSGMIQEETDGEWAVVGQSGYMQTRLG